MHHRALLLSLCLLPTLACGPLTPKGEGDSDGESEAPPGSSSGDAPEASTTGSESAADPTPTTGEPEPTGEPGTSTGAPETCFPGQAPWSSLAGAEVPVSEELHIPIERDILAPLADGNVALAVHVVGDQQESPALLIASPAGEVLKLSQGEPSEKVRAQRLVRDPGGGLVSLMLRVEGSAVQPVLQRFAADGELVGEVALALPLLAEDLELSDGAALLVGLDKAAEARSVVKVALGTGAVVWNVALGGATELLPEQIAVTPEGHVVVGARGDSDDQGFTSVRLFRLDGEGGPVWASEIEVPHYGGLSELALTPDGQVVVLRVSDGNTRVDLLSVGLADGETRWERTLAVKDEQGESYARNILVDADALTIPLMHTLPDQGWIDSLGVARVSLTGELLPSVALPEVPQNPAPVYASLAARGDCGELVVVTGWGEPLWLGTFAP